APAHDVLARTTGASIRLQLAATTFGNIPGAVLEVRPEAPGASVRRGFSSGSGLAAASVTGCGRLVRETRPCYSSAPCPWVPTPPFLPCPPSPGSTPSSSAQVHGSIGSSSIATSAGRASRRRRAPSFVHG